MSRRMKKYKKELCFLGTCTRQQRTNFIKHAPTDIIHSIGDVANTVLTGNLPIQNKYRKKLRRQLTGLKQLALKRGSIARKRTLLSSQRGGSILGTLWTIIKSLF